MISDPLPVQEMSRVFALCLCTLRAVEAVIHVCIVNQGVVSKLDLATVPQSDNFSSRNNLKFNDENPCLFTTSNIKRDAKINFS